MIDDDVFELTSDDERPDSTNGTPDRVGTNPPPSCDEPEFHLALIDSTKDESVVGLHFDDLLDDVDTKSKTQAADGSMKPEAAQPNNFPADFSPDSDDAEPAGENGRLPANHSAPVAPPAAAALTTSPSALEEVVLTPPSPAEFSLDDNNGQPPSKSVESRSVTAGFVVTEGGQIRTPAEISLSPEPAGQEQTTSHQGTPAAITELTRDPGLGSDQNRAEPAEAESSVVHIPNQDAGRKNDPLARRRADIDAKQAVVARILKELDCEAVLLLMPAHVAWLTGGMTLRGLIADGERPGIYTNGRQRWLVCGNVDTQRLFDEELDGLGFMVKEWQWSTGRAVLLGDMLAGKKVACDRPFPNMPLVNDKLRPELRPLYDADKDRYTSLGKIVALALEATARGLRPGDSEREAAGQLAHRLYHHGVEISSISVTADDRAGRFRRAGFTNTPIRKICNLQVTATLHGLFATASRTLSFGPLTQTQRSEFDACIRQSAVYRVMSTPGSTLTSAATAAARILENTPFEHEWRLSQPGYAVGWFAADELRKASNDEKFILHLPIMWQTRIGSMAIADTVLVTNTGGQSVTPPGSWPYQRVKLKAQEYDLPDVLIRS